MRNESRIAARRAKNKALAAKMTGKGAAEPTVPQDDKSALGYALTWYSQNTDKKQQKNWSIEYWTQKGDKDILAIFKKVPDWAFMTYGSSCRLRMREQWVDPKSDWFERRTEELKNNYTKYYEKPEEDSEKPKPRVKTIQERIADKAMEIGASLEGDIDDFAANGYMRTYKRVTKLFDISSPVAKNLLPDYERQLAELEELVGPAPKSFANAKEEDLYNQLLDGYSHIKKNQQKAYRDFVKEIVSDLRKMAVVKSRAPRKRKPKPPAQVVKYLKYKIKDDALGISSVDKTRMVDASEIFLYNTKSRRLQYYVPQDGYLLTVRGTTILNFDPEKSGQKTVRKPEEIKDLAGKTKLPIRKAFNTLKTKAIKLNGRVNADCIILGAFL